MTGDRGDDTPDPGAGGVGAQNLFGLTGDDTCMISAYSGRCRILTWAEKDVRGNDRMMLRDLTLDDVSVTSQETGTADGVQLVIAWCRNGACGEVTMAHMAAFVETIEFADGQIPSAGELLV